MRQNFFELNKQVHVIIYVFLQLNRYGDIVPKTNNGKLFATAYVLLGGTLLLGEMSVSCPL